MDDSGIDGASPTLLVSPSVATQAANVAREITRLIHDEGVNPEDIAVLVAGTPKEKYYDRLRNKPLPRPAKWSREEHFQDESVLIDTVKRFKGLERDVVFLWIDEVSAVDDTQMYVGISRARSILYVVGDSNTVKLVADLAGTP